MHTEHLQSVRPGIVAMAWFISVAVTSLIIMALLGLNLIDAESDRTIRVSIAAVAFGFFAGGAFAGLRAAEAPILHGVMMGLASLLVWFVLNIVMAAFADEQWTALSAQLAITLILVQIVAAVLGARLGYRQAVRGDT